MWFFLVNGNFICSFCGTTIDRTKSNWLDHVNVYHPSDFKLLSNELREKRMESENVLNQALNNVSGEVVYNHCFYIVFRRMMFVIMKMIIIQFRYRLKLIQFFVLIDFFLMKSQYSIICLIDKNHTLFLSFLF